MITEGFGGEVFEISGGNGTYIESRVGEFADTVAGDHNIPDMTLDAAVGYLRERGRAHGFHTHPVATEMSLEELKDYVGVDKPR